MEGLHSVPVEYQFHVSLRHTLSSWIIDFLTCPKWFRKRTWKRKNEQKASIHIKSKKKSCQPNCILLQNQKGKSYSDLCWVALWPHPPTSMLLLLPNPPEVQGIWILSLVGKARKTSGPLFLSWFTNTSSCRYLMIAPESHPLAAAASPDSARRSLCQCLRDPIRSHPATASLWPSAWRTGPSAERNARIRVRPNMGQYRKMAVLIENVGWMMMNHLNSSCLMGAILWDKAIYWVYCFNRKSDDLSTA